MRPTVRAALALPLMLAMTSPAWGAETITYSYDAKGRLVKAAHSGSVNNGLRTTYSHDKADNRKNKTTTGSPN